MCVHTNRYKEILICTHLYKMCTNAFYTNIHTAVSVTLNTEKVGSRYLRPSVSGSNRRNISQEQWATKYSAKPLNRHGLLQADVATN